ncbi:Arabinanase/levansucrase/invertase [Purpureocillium lilacinum]|nr:Arabinanase/levansucrase/invertase [Purpureocillium lilacinum]OAQ94796.1 Arabinanase/levansucrase/invertase [Purpureocillium lilacinum]GJN66929.1 hypothetical protein PLICBS_000951 [Purpureocillium lilacinum]
MSPSTAYSSTPPKITPASREGDANYKAPIFPIGPFTKYEQNPLLVPNPKNEFESGYIYNAAAIVLDDTIFLLYRAQNPQLKSSVGLAWSTDGFNFTRLDRPVLEASEPWEAGGGVEDPRIARFDGVFYMTYTSWDFKTPRLCLATSTDLVHWEKRPPLFPNMKDVEFNSEGRTLYREGHSKSGAIFPEKNAEGRYVMIFGDSHLYLAESDDLLNWTAKPFSEHFAAPTLAWESRLLEPGPAPVKTRDGKWILVYNAATLGTARYRNNQYSISQMLIDYQHLENGPVARLDQPSVVVSAQNEREGLVNEVVFTEGMVQFKGQWFLYFGQADSELGVATAPVN